jgi:hypothetical protein
MFGGEVAGFASISVADLTSLSALATSGFLQGTLAYVAASGGSYWSWYPTGSTVPAGAVTQAGVNGTWALAPSIVQTQPDNVTNILPLMVQPAASPGYTTPSPALFEFGVEEELFTTTYDAVGHLGYNIFGANATEPQVRWSIESNYEFAPGDKRVEAHLQCYEPGTVAGFIRPLSISYQRGNSTAPAGPKGLLEIFMQWNDAGTPNSAFLSFSEYSTSSQIVNWKTDSVQFVPAQYIFNYNVAIWQTAYAAGTNPNSVFSLRADSVGANRIEIDGYNQLYTLKIANTRCIYAYGGQLSLGFVVKGDGAPLLYAATAPTLGHGGATVLTATQASNPVLQLTDTGLTSNATVTLPTTASPAEWTVDLTGVVFGGHSVNLTMGTGGKTVTVSAQSVVRVYSDGVGKLYALTYT